MRESMTLNEQIQQFILKSEIPDNLMVEIHKIMNRLKKERLAPGIEVGEKAPLFCLEDHNGKEICLKDFLGKGPIVISFFRGEWCPFCNLEIKALQDILNSIENLGGALLAIGPQLPEYAEKLKNRHNISFHILCDIDQQVIRDFKLQFLLPNDYRELVNFEINKFNADGSWYLPVPATYILDHHGIVRARYVDMDYSKRMEPLEILENLQSLSYFEHVFKNNPMGIAVLNTKGFIVDHNDSLTSILQTQKGIGLVGVNLLNEVEFSDPALSVNLLDIFQNKKKYINIKRLEIFFNHTSESKIIEFRASQLVLSGRVTGAICVFNDITENEKLNSKLKKHGDYVQTILDSQENIIIVTDGINMKNCNQKLLSFTDYKSYKDFKLDHDCICDFFIKEEGYIYENNKGEWLGKVIELAPQKRLVKMYDSKLNENRIFHITFKQFPQKELEYIISFTDVTEAEHQKLILNEIIEEVSEKHKTSLQIAKINEEKYRHLFNSLEDPIYVISVNDDGLPDRFLAVNEAAVKMLGYSQEEFLAMAPFEINDPDAYNTIMPYTIENILNNHKALFETIHITKDGKKIPCEVNANLTTMNGNPIVMSIVRDITERKAYEEQIKWESMLNRILADVSKNLLEEKNFNAVNTAILDSALSITQSRDGFVGYIDQKTQEFIIPSLSPALVEFYEKSEIKIALDNLKGVLKNVLINKAPVMKNEATEDSFCFKKKSDIQNHLENLLLVPVLNKKELSGVIFVANSTTPYTDKELEALERLAIHYAIAINNERTSIKDRENKAMLIQQSKMAAMGGMINAIAHQWKQPLNAISIIASMIEKVKGVPDKQFNQIRQFVYDILDQINFMSETVDSFRTFLKPSKEKMTFDIISTIESVIKILKPQFAVKGISVNIVPGNNFLVEGYLNEFKQVILNIFNNAKDVFLEKKITNGEIHVRLIKGETRGTIIIEDSGGGIPEELLPEKLFQSFASTKGEKGTGIGLSLSKTIIESSMNGKITAKNTDIGAQFIIELPIRKAKSNIIFK